MLNDSDGVNLPIMFISLLFSSYHVDAERKENLWDWVHGDVSSLSSSLILVVPSGA